MGKGLHVLLSEDISARAASMIDVVGRFTYLLSFSGDIHLEEVPRAAISLLSLLLLP